MSDLSNAWSISKLATAAGLLALLAYSIVLIRLVIPNKIFFSS